MVTLSRRKHVDIEAGQLGLHPIEHLYAEIWSDKVQVQLMRRTMLDPDHRLGWLVAATFHVPTLELSLLSVIVTYLRRFAWSVSRIN
jgi:hypothetical protein